MIAGASVFSQVLGLIRRDEFERAVRQHRANRYVKSFPCWGQFVGMLFAQLAQAHSLREICSGLRCCLGKLRHLGLEEAPRKSTLAYANEHRPWQLYQTVFNQLLGRCQELVRGRKRFKFRFKNKLYSLDSTTIDLCLSLYDWAKFRRTKGAIKLHLLLDHDGYLPSFAVITDGKTHDVRIARKLSFQPGTVLVIDRGYVDYELFARWTEEEVWFVTRLKEGAAYRVVESREVPANSGILADELIELTGIRGQATPHCLRRIAYKDPETEQVLVFLTNHIQFGATTIARIYKERWQVELFFKAIKQNLRIKTFVGTSANAVQVQIWTALIAILLLRYLQFSSRLAWALSNLVALLRLNLFTYRNLWHWLDNPYETPPIVPEAEQLSLGLT